MSRVRDSFPLYFPLSFLCDFLALYFFLGLVWAEGNGACNVPPVD